MTGAGVGEAIYAYCADCGDGSEVGITRAEAERWADEHNARQHPES